MSTRETMDDQKRRARINRMKRAIIAILVFWMVFSLAAIILLAVTVAGLSDRLKRMERSLMDGTAKLQEGTERPGGLETEESDSEGADGADADASVFQYEFGMDDEENLAEAGDTHKVYLTFDGGPDDNTDAILDVLKSYKVKATFFVNGNESVKLQAVYRRIVADGHTLGMRSYSNRYSEIYVSEKAFEQDLDNITDFLYRLTGLRSQYYRFPGGSANEISNVGMTELAQVLKKRGISWFDWNVTADDLAVDSRTEDVVASVLRGVDRYKTSVVLLHEGTGRDTTVKALGSLIEALQERTAEILPISEETYVVQYIKEEQLD